MAHPTNCESEREITQISESDKPSKEVSHKFMRNVQPLIFRREDGSLLKPPVAPRHWVGSPHLRSATINLLDRIPSNLYKLYSK
jgi:hypothetical protein